MYLGHRALWERAEAAARASYALFDALDDAVGRVRALHAFAYVRWRQLRPAEALELTERALDWARRSGDEMVLADALIHNAFAVPTLAATIERADEAAPIYVRAGNFLRLGQLELTVGHTALCDGAYTTAEAALRRARSGALAAGSTGGQYLPMIDGEEGLLAVFTGEHRRAAGSFRSELRGAQRYGMDRLVFEALMGLAAVLAAAGDVAAAARMHGAADAFDAERLDGAERLDNPPVSARLDAIRAAARAGDEWGDGYAAGRRLDAGQAIELAETRGQAHDAVGVRHAADRLRRDLLHGGLDAVLGDAAPALQLPPGRRADGAGPCRGGAGGLRRRSYGHRAGSAPASAFRRLSAGR